jgi:hypothetical protein
VDHDKPKTYQDLEVQQSDEDWSSLPSFLPHPHHQLEHNSRR